MIKVAAILVTFLSSPPVPSQTMDWAMAAMLDVDRYYAEQSYGQFLTQSDVYGVYTVALDQNATRDDIKREARAAATAAGVDLTPYGEHIVYSAPITKYAVAGFASTFGVWMNVDVVPVIGDHHMPAHELGHHFFGLQHARGYVCSIPPLSGTCQSYQYGDTLDRMGQGVGHFNAITKASLKWLTPLDVVKDGTFSLAPYETTDAGLKALKVITKQWTYFLEYRQPIGFDVYQPWADPNNVFNGVTIHLQLNGSMLLQMSTPDPVSPYPNTITAPALTVGQTYCDRDSRVAISVLSATPEAATVHVDFGACK